ncbi:MAG: AI-2E family transporter [Bryobacteraceae bacterium]|nr:AI-2E family transporter [Bryobacteraceae bacterium]MCX7603685.1 AI-2E family transporter [Bryobacteraceae bacterium]
MESAAAPDRPARIASVLASLLLITAILYFGRVFFITFVSAVLLAFLLEPVVNGLMRLRAPRGLASFLACALMLAVVYLLGLGLWLQVQGLWEDLPNYSRRIAELVDAAVQQIEEVEKTAREIIVPKRLREAPPQTEPAPAQPKARRKAAPAAPPPAQVQEVRIQREEGQLVNAIYQRLAAYTDAALMASFVPFLVYFMLSWRDHILRAVLNALPGERERQSMLQAWNGIAQVARAYLVGNFILGVLLSVASASFFWFVKLPYWQVVGPLSGFLSLVPYLGLPLALIPPLVAALPIYNTLPAYLVIGATTAVFHLIALNLLYPKLVGARVHLNPLVVTIALMLWYLLWGAAGLFLAIPITAGLKAAFDSIPSLRPYGQILGT